MEFKKEPTGMLDLTIYPGFSVKENVIMEVNQAASGLLLSPGTDVRNLLLTGQEEYAAFQSGYLYLKLNILHGGIGATVFRKEGTDYFLLDEMYENNVLQALALAAHELRSTMTGTMIAADQLSEMVRDNPAAAEPVARLNRSLHRMLRIVGNMSDAQLWPRRSHQEVMNISGVVAEVFRKAQELSANTGIELTYDVLPEAICSLMDPQQLERAILNILSNALKFTPSGGTIHAAFTRCGRMLRLTVQDSGSGIEESIRSSLFHRYLRQPVLEDSRHGIGLGMTLIRSVAAAHGGTVLIDQPTQGGTRVTMTLAIRQNSTAQLRSPVFHVDYAGERDHALLELSDSLPCELYQK